jgi:hypothetical protein
LIESLDLMFQGKPQPPKVNRRGNRECCYESFVCRLLPPLTAESLAPALDRAEDLMLLLERWVERGWLRALDKAFVGFLA